MQRNRILIGISVAILAVVIAVGTFAFIRGPHVFYNPEAPASLKEGSLAFVGDVVGLNLTEYQVINFHFWPQWDVASASGLPLYLVRYDLKSPGDEAIVDIYYTKSNDTYLHEPYFDMQSGTLFAPAYPSDKVLNWTRGFMERYISYKNNASYLLGMHKTLDSIEHIEPLNDTRDDISLQISIREFSEEDIYTTIQFRPANSTAHNYAVTFEYHNGRLFQFVDTID